MGTAVAPERDRLAIRAANEDVRTASEWLERTCAERDVPPDQTFRLDLCLNEALANIISHGGPSALAAPIGLALAVAEDAGGAHARLSLSDSGQAFDPVHQITAPRAPTLADAEPGGLGLTMIRGYCDQLSHERRDGTNHLTIVVRWVRS